MNLPVLVFANNFREAERWAWKAELLPLDWVYVYDTYGVRGRGHDGHYVNLLRFPADGATAMDVARYDRAEDAIRHLRSQGWRELVEGS